MSQIQCLNRSRATVIPTPARYDATRHDTPIAVDSRLHRTLPNVEPDCLIKQSINLIPSVEIGKLELDAVVMFPFSLKTWRTKSAVIMTGLLCLALV